MTTPPSNVTVPCVNGEADTSVTVSDWEDSLAGPGRSLASRSATGIVSVGGSPAASAAMRRCVARVLDDER